MTNTQSKTKKKIAINSPLEGWTAKQDGVFVLKSESPKIPLLRGGTGGDGVFCTRQKLSKYKNLPYNPKLKEKATQLRKSGNLSEVLFWQRVKKGQLLDLDFERQKIIGSYIVDFYCPELGLVVEIDGESHDFKGEYDNVRDNYLRSLGLKVLHIEDVRIKKDLDNLMNQMLDLVVGWKTNTPSLRATPQEGNFGN